MDKNDSATISPSGESSMTVQKLPATTPLPAAERGCPVMAFQAMISGKYKIRILWELKDGPRRYSEIRAGLLRGAAGTKEIAPRVLSRELKALVAAGLIARKDYGLVPPKVEYRLTQRGESFAPIIASIREWGERHLGGQPQSARSTRKRSDFAQRSALLARLSFKLGRDPNSEP
jgi:DNA-binding HxlR family transcriptional regulator